MVVRLVGWSMSSLQFWRNHPFPEMLVMAVLRVPPGVPASARYIGGRGVNSPRRAARPPTPPTAARWWPFTLCYSSSSPPPRPHKQVKHINMRPDPVQSTRREGGSNKQKLAQLVHTNSAISAGSETLLLLLGLTRLIV